MPAAQSRGSPKKRIIRRMRKYLLHYVLLLLFCLAIAFIMCYTVFFKLDKIKISGCTMYSESQIVDEIGAQKGDSMFQINISNAEKRLLGKMPYLKTVNISRQFPTTLKVEIVEETVLGAVYTADGFAIISDTGKVLQEGVLTLPEGMPRIVGLKNQSYDTGSYLNESVSSGGGLQKEILSLQIVSQQLAAYQFDDITYYDVIDLRDIKVMIEDRLLLELGSDTDMEYKCKFIRGVLDGKSSGDEKFESVPEEGVLDFSNPPALHTMSMSIDKVKNEEAYLDFGAAATPATDNVAGGQESQPMTPQTSGEEQTHADSAPEEEAAAGETVAEVKTGSLIGNFKIYAYCPCTKCCGSGASGITATGTEATEGRTIAVDPDIIPLGSKVVMDGHEYTAEDTGGGIDGYTIDLFMNSHEEALQWGVQYRDIYWA